MQILKVSKPKPKFKMNFGILNSPLIETIKQCFQGPIYLFGYLTLFLFLLKSNRRTLLMETTMKIFGLQFCSQQYHQLEKNVCRRLKEIFWTVFNLAQQFSSDIAGNVLIYYTRVFFFYKLTVGGSKSTKSQKKESNKIETTNNKECPHIDEAYRRQMRNGKVLLSYVTERYIVKKLYK